MKVFDFGLKGNWRAFKEYVEARKISYGTNYYFVFEEDDCGDEVVVFNSHDDLDGWLTQTFWERERYDTNNLEDSMEDFKVWKLISETDIKRLSNLYKGSKPTSIVINEIRYYRKLIPISVEPTVIISTNFY